MQTYNKWYIRFFIFPLYILFFNVLQYVLDNSFKFQLIKYVRIVHQTFLKC